jgi:hypothetical protein
MLVAMLSFSATGLLADYFPAMRKGRNYLRGKAETARSAFSIGCHFLSSYFSLLPSDYFNAAPQGITNQTDAACRVSREAFRGGNGHLLSAPKRAAQTYLRSFSLCYHGSYRLDG